ncbi:hypothetical protein ACFOHU_03695 [Ottowia pentelensis]|uniref:ATP-binding protein n=1 Tax=Ottowia pentelensis TaxID=511108 RepID=A0ABV6PV77_9BURK
MTEDASKANEPAFPAGLRDWSGNQAGGVRRLFEAGSGRPTRDVLQTHLLRRLHAWTQAIASRPDKTPGIVLLVGGPGNGKTEAIESTIEWLDHELGSGGTLVATLREQLQPGGAKALQRVARASVLAPTSTRKHNISIVQDASLEPNSHSSRAALLVQELADALHGAPEGDIYLSCVNRGVLDDAMVHATDQGPADIQALLAATIRAVAQGAGAEACWPLQAYPSVAVWPMDIESLLVKTRDGDPAPALTILAKALDADSWPTYGQCEAKNLCPFCRSRQVLSTGDTASNFLTVLRWHELATAKRWTFRDFFTLVSFLLSGQAAEGAGASNLSPCQWAAKLVDLDQSRQGSKPDSKRSTAIYTLVAHQYQHQLFGSWNKRSARRLHEDIKEVGLVHDHVAMGLYYFLRAGGTSKPPSMIEGLLEGLCDSLDPALADPADQVQINASERVRLRDLDAYLSQSVRAGRDALVKHRCMSPAEVELLGRLADLDRELSTPALRRRRPDAATRIQHALRDFASRLVRRTLGTRSAVTRDAMLLKRFRGIAEDRGASQGDALLRAARDVQRLLNNGEKFEVPLTTTFGQPAAPVALRASLVTSKQSIRPLDDDTEDRPWSSTRYLKVGKGQREHAIALTFELYRAIELISAGLSRASLPREVNALIDATKATLSGPIVRDEDSLADSIMDLGVAGLQIEMMGSRFLTIEGRE